MAGAVLPMVALLERNRSLFGSWWRTGYALSHEQSAFSIEDLRRNLVPYLSDLWQVALGPRMLTVRSGIAHDTAAAKPGWLRADIDGAARTTMAIGGGLQFGRFQIDAGFGVSLEGKNNNAGDCNPISPMPQDLGCNRDGVEKAIEDRRGPDPLNPLLVPKQQLEAPVNQGVFDSRYVMFMLGMSTRLW